MEEQHLHSMTIVVCRWGAFQRVLVLGNEAAKWGGASDLPTQRCRTLDCSKGTGREVAHLE
jgi:hypothetical protein